MVKPSFAVSAFVVTILIATAFVIEGLRPLLPARVSNRLAQNPSAFLRQASSQPIDWRPLSNDAVAQARREGKPILLLVGASWSNLAREIDRDVFTEPDVARLLRREYVCIRVDGTQRPEYLNGFLPLSRLRNPFLPGFQLWVLRPDGGIVDFEGRTAARQRFDRKTILDYFRSSRDLFAASLNPDSTSSKRYLQEAELTQIRSGGGSLLPDYTNFRIGLESVIDSRYGGLPYNGFQTPPLQALRFMLLSGDLVGFRAAVDPILTSPLVDLQQGGFFRLSNAPNWSKVEYDKIAVQNADWLELLATAASILEAPSYRALAQRTFDFLLTNMNDRGYVWACQVGLQERNHRSRQFSFTPSMLQMIPDADRDFARRELRLDPYVNPQMIPHLRSLSTLHEQETIRRLLEPLKGRTTPDLQGEKQADVQGYVTAKMILAANLLNDADRASQVIACMDRVEQFRSGDTVMPSLENMASDVECLSDYLSISDAYLQDFLINGRVPSLASGLQVLRRAIFLFSGEVEGEFINAPRASYRMGALSTFVPEIADTLRESSSAQMVRLLLSYSRILGNTNEAKEFRKSAYASCNLYSNLIGTQPTAGGFFCATMAVADDAAFFTVGPRATEQAQYLARVRPGRLAAPVIGGVRPDLADQEPGIYIEERGEIRGPLTMNAALEQIPAQFRLVTP